MALSSYSTRPAPGTDDNLGLWPFPTERPEDICWFRLFSAGAELWLVRAPSALNRRARRLKRDLLIRRSLHTGILHNRGAATCIVGENRRVETPMAL